MPSPSLEVLLFWGQPRGGLPLRTLRVFPLRGHSQETSLTLAVMYQKVTLLSPPSRDESPSRPSVDGALDNPICYATRTTVTTPVSTSTNNDGPNRPPGGKRGPPITGSAERDPISRWDTDGPYPRTSATRTDTAIGQSINHSQPSCRRKELDRNAQVTSRTRKHGREGPTMLAHKRHRTGPYLKPHTRTAPHQDAP